MRQDLPATSTTTASKRVSRGVRAAFWTLRATRNVLAVLGLFFCFLLYRGVSAYQADMTASQQDASCAKPARCM